MNFVEMVNDLHAKGLLSDEYVEKLAHRVAEMMKAPRTKLAFFGSPTPTRGILQSILESPTGQQLALAGSLAAGSAIKGLFSKAIENRAVNQSKAEMMEQFPELQSADPSLVDRTFDVVRQYAPDVAKNPTVSGTFVKGVLQFPDASVTPEHVRSLVSVQQGMEDRSSSPLDEMSRSMAGAAGAGFGRRMSMSPEEKELEQLNLEQGRHRQSMQGMDRARGYLGAAGDVLGLVTGGQKAWSDRPGFMGGGDELKELQRKKLEMEMSGGMPERPTPPGQGNLWHMQELLTRAKL